MDDKPKGKMPGNPDTKNISTKEFREYVIEGRMLDLVKQAKNAVAKG